MSKVICVNYSIYKWLIRFLMIWFHEHSMELVTHECLIL